MVVLQSEAETPTATRTGGPLSLKSSWIVHVTADPGTLPVDARGEASYLSRRNIVGLTNLELKTAPGMVPDRGPGNTPLIPKVKILPRNRVHLAAAGAYNPMAPCEGGTTESLDTVLAALAEEGITFGPETGLETKSLPDGWTPLFHSVRSGSVANVQSLIAMGADVTVRDKHGNTPLHKACVAGSTAKVQILVDAGAPLEASNRYGRTPLHEAAHVGWSGCCALLVRIGADAHAKDGPLRDGDTPFQVANEAGWSDVCTALKANERRRVKLSGGDTSLYSATFPCVEPAPFSPKRMAIEAPFSPKGLWGKDSKNGTWGKPPDPTIPLFYSRVTRYW